MWILALIIMEFSSVKQYLHWLKCRQQCLNLSWLLGQRNYRHKINKPLLIPMLFYKVYVELWTHLFYLLNGWVATAVGSLAKASIDFLDRLESDQQSTYLCCLWTDVILALGKMDRRMTVSTNYCSSQWAKISKATEEKWPTYKKSTWAQSFWWVTLQFAIG